jgi:hypothetical protein
MAETGDRRSPTQGEDQDPPRNRRRPAEACVGAPRMVDVVLFPDGSVIFSWNSQEIQEMADSLGIVEFETPRWCG